MFSSLIDFLFWYIWLYNFFSLCLVFFVAGISLFCVVLGAGQKRDQRRGMGSYSFEKGLHVFTYLLTGWLGSRVVSMLYSGAEGPGFKSKLRRCRVSLSQTVHTHRACVHQAAKLVAVIFRVAVVTAGLAESNGSLPPGL